MHTHFRGIWSSPNTFNVISYLHFDAPPAQDFFLGTEKIVTVTNTIGSLFTKFGNIVKFSSGNSGQFHLPYKVIKIPM